MKKLPLIWFALYLTFNPVAYAVASMMDYLPQDSSAAHCHGDDTDSRAPQPRDAQEDCCKSMYDTRQCCDHCVNPVSGLLNNVYMHARGGAADPVAVHAERAPSRTNSPPYKPPQA
jgi:hypothetical protein